MNELQNRTLSTIEKIEEARHDIVKDIVHELEDRAIGARTATYDGLHEALRVCLAGVGIHDLSNQHNASASPATMNPAASDERTVMPNFYWTGRFRRVPPDFALLKCLVAHLWTLWRCGNAEKQVPPLHLLETADLPNRNSQKRLSDVRYLMKKIEAYATARNLLRSRQSVEEAVRVYTACLPAVEVPHSTNHVRKRRRGQLSWVSINHFCNFTVIKRPTQRITYQKFTKLYRPKRYFNQRESGTIRIIFNNFPFCFGEYEESIIIRELVSKEEFKTAVNARNVTHALVEHYTAARNEMTGCIKDNRVGMFKCLTMVVDFGVPKFNTKNIWAFVYILLTPIFGIDQCCLERVISLPCMESVTNAFDSPLRDLFGSTTDSRPDVKWMMTNGLGFAGSGAFLIWSIHPRRWHAV
ncbi:hypothetical protein PHPALM_32130 [Phytophthora palmivora]|uniref:Uncharacterized protein n=1 Tax=Phytophthora palmivora TaxID=4796 RepID=A0A2P4X0W6_9STRA|nr:hypothetical protein PHPALM_32130 [Phytophthora palmivora]